ncbi:D-alanine--D-alanine ligase A [Floricoccus tropicus]|uniref:D-alanine--D-alanine ligase n=1 Tax=Floricoccus tropicus TaxID=1859473 RepID=A0A1E8GMY5_9LACT|nr:D-alanine--D-alanine ligase [Floricoccus tropicus]OFI49624.1 D-alanine--D-alanine ligase A [Floricoccus tropicus]
MKEVLILLYGGRSAERDVSVLSAESVMRAVDYSKHTVKTFFISHNGDFIKTQEFDEKPADDEKLMTNISIDLSAKIKPSDIYEEGAVVFPVLHGPMGEDGSIQGFLEILKMPYIGPNITAASVTMDKIMTKHVLDAVGVPQVPYVAVVGSESINEKMVEVNEKLTYPVFVKPANMGSSVGVSKIDSADKLEEGLREAFKFDNRIAVEQGVDAREIEVAVLGNLNVKSTLAGEVVKDVAFYDYNSKYINNKITMDIPAHVDEKIMEELRFYAELAYRTVNGSGLSRCDFFLTKDGKYYLNEINAIPGFTQYSMYPLLWENMGLPYADLIEQLIILAKEAFEVREGHLK